MKKTTCVILGLAFLVLGILGITGLVKMFQSDPVYVNIGEIILGGLGFLGWGILPAEYRGLLTESRVLSAGKRYRPAEKRH